MAQLRGAYGVSTRGEVFVGDLVKAVALLRPRDRETAAAMADLLGLALREPDPPFVPAVLPPAATPTSEAEPPPSTTAPDAPRPPEGDGVSAPRPDPTAAVQRDIPRQSLPELVDWQPVPKLAERTLDFSLARTGPPRGEGDRSGTEETPAEITDADTTDLSGAEAPGGHPTAPEPPWAPEWARGVMVAAVSAPVASRQLDQRALVRKVSRQQVLRAVPWRRRPSTRRGVQLLLDHSAGMAPFRDDRLWLRALLESVAGRDRVEVLRFTGSPRRGVVRVGTVGSERYRAPAPGTPVVLVSDLGRIRPPFTGGATAPLDEWLDFVEGVLHSGCPPVCLTPFPASAYPHSVRGRVALIPFDRRISLRHAREATRAVHRLLEERS